MGERLFRAAAPAVILLIIVSVSVIARAAESIDNSQLFEDASSGDREAQYTLAHLLLKGRGGLDADAVSAAGWFEKAAANGHRDAAYDLAMLYLEGDRLGKNVEKALAWLIVAAERGHTEAQYYLGRAYRKSDPERAAGWLEKARDGGHTEAASVLERLCGKEELFCR